MAEHKSVLQMGYSVPDDVTIVKGEDEDIYASDPANYFVGTLVTHQIRESLSEFMAFLKDRPELQTVLNKMLPRLCKAGYVSIKDDRIHVLVRNPMLRLKTCDFNFVPKLLGIVARRVRNNYLNNPTEAFKNGDDLAWRTYPDHPKVRRRLADITNHFLAELDQLTDDVNNDSSLTADKVRICAYMNANLEPEDF